MFDMEIIESFRFSSVTINKTVELENNTDTLKRLSTSDKPNNQTKLANISSVPLPPGQIKCNILKGNLFVLRLSFFLFAKTQRHSH